MDLGLQTPEVELLSSRNLRSLEPDELRLRFLKRGATWLMLVPLREIYETGPRSAKKQNKKTSKDQRTQLLPPGPLLT